MNISAKYTAPQCMQKGMRKPFLYTQSLNCIVCINIVGKDWQACLNFKWKMDPTKMEGNRNLNYLSSAEYVLS